MSPVSAVIYVRQSLDKTGEAAAVQRQERECRDVAGRQGWNVERVYTDNDRSATSGVRPAWRELLDDVRAGRVRVVIAWHTDRLYRRTRDTLDLIEAGEPYGLRITTVRNGELDLSTPSGRMVAVTLSSVARYEVEQKGDRQRAANLQRARAGHVGWTRRPYGYEKDDTGHIVIVDGEATELREAARRILDDGVTVSTIVRELNKRSVPTTTGAQWTQTAFTRLLKSPRLAGRAVSNGVDYGPAEWAPIFDAETADRLRAKLTDPRRRTAPQSLAIKYLLTGLLTCGKCGAKMYASPASTPNGRRWMIYRCMARQHLARRLDLVDDVVDALVVERMSRPDAARILAPDLDVAGVRAEAVELRERRDGLAAMLAAGLLGVDAVREQATALTARITEAERLLVQATGASPLVALIASDDVAATWRAMTLTAKRETVRTLFESITVLPVTRGARFAPEQVVHVWRT